MSCAYRHRTQSCQLPKGLYHRVNYYNKLLCPVDVHSCRIMIWHHIIWNVLILIPKHEDIQWTATFRAVQHTYIHYIDLFGHILLINVMVTLKLHWHLQAMLWIHVYSVVTQCSIDSRYYIAHCNDLFWQTNEHLPTCLLNPDTKFIQILPMGTLSVTTYRLNRVTP